MNDIEEITKSLLKFRNDRDWEQFHNPKDLAIAINIESSELLELFLWKEPGMVNKEKVEEELADILAFTFLMANHYQLDIKQTILKKIALNNKKYPVEKSKGNAKKYDEL